MSDNQATFKAKEMDITKTKGYHEAMEDIKLGRVKSASSVDDMFNQILGETGTHSDLFSK